MLPAGDPKVEYYAQTRAIFGSDDVAVVGVRARDIFAPSTIEKIARVTDEIAKVDGVEHVLSITNAVDPAADVLHPPRLLPGLPPGPEEVEALKQKLVATPLYGKNLVADDFTGAAINVFFKNLNDEQYLDLGVDRKIMDILAARQRPEEFFYTGAAHVKQAAVELMRRDLVRFTPIALVLVLLVLWFSFRTVRGVVLPVLTVGGALVCLPAACLTYRPAALRLIPTRLRSARSGKISPRLSENLRRLGERAFAKRREILWGAAALALVALAGAWRIRVDSDFLYYFEPRSEVRRANEAINQKIVGSNPFYIVIDGGAPGALRRWEVLKLIKDLQGFLAGQAGITSSISVVDYLEVLEAGFHKQAEGGDLLIDEQGNLVPAEAPKPFWQDPKSLRPLLDTMMKSPETFKSVVTKDFSRASILVRTSLCGPRRIEA